MRYEENGSASISSMVSPIVLATRCPYRGREAMRCLFLGSDEETSPFYMYPWHVYLLIINYPIKCCLF
jgi:hypothetical protein